MTLTKINPLHPIRLRLSLNQQLRRKSTQHTPPSYPQRKLLHLTAAVNQAFSLAFGHFGFHIPNQQTPQ